MPNPLIKLKQKFIGKPGEGKRAYFCGATPDEKDERDYIYKDGVSADNLARAYFSKSDSEFNLIKYSCPVMNQGQTNSCTGHAACVAMNILINRTIGKEHNDLKLNPFWNYYWARYEDGSNYIKQDCGATIRSLMKALKQYGVISCDKIKKVNDSMVAGKECDAFKIKDYERVEGDLDERVIKLRYALEIEKLPVVACFKVIYDDIDANTGIVKGVNTNAPASGYHAIPIIGYKYIKDKLYFIFQNSWGVETWRTFGWGDNGFGYLHESYIKNYILTPDLWIPSVKYF